MNAGSPNAESLDDLGQNVETMTLSSHEVLAKHEREHEDLERKGSERMKSQCSKQNERQADW
jgi:hypothetical protein